MSVIVSGPRRVFVMLLMCECTRGVCPQALARPGPALGAEPATDCGWNVPAWRQVIGIRLQRIVWGWLVGLRVLVLAPVDEPQRLEPGTGRP